MSAADLLRAAIEAAPEDLYVAPDAWGELAVWAGDKCLIQTYRDGGQNSLRLIGLLLAAAPHLADLLDLPPDGPSAPRIADLLGQIDAAITEAGESL